MARARRGRMPSEYSRRGPVREPYDYVLIICEGSKTEPNYLNGLRIACQLSSANIRVINADGTDPMTIVRAGEAESRSKEGYDRIYCVFDRNGHANFQEALTRLNSSEAYKKGSLIPIVSIPCFEVWVLLHFGYSSAPYMTVGNKSACDQVLSDVKRKLATYAKGSKTAYAELAELIEDAIKNAKRLEKHNQDNDSDNPATQMHVLVEYLRNLRKLAG